MHHTLRTVLAVLTIPTITSVAVAQAPAPKPAAPPAAAAAPAAAAMPMTPPKPAPEFEAFMKGGDGSWKCDTTMVAGAMGPGSPEMKTKCSIKIKKVLDGFAYEGEMDQKKTKEMPGVKGKFTMAFDSSKKLLLSNFMDSMGTVVSTSGTISGDSATLTGSGTMMGQAMKVRETIVTKAGGKEMTHTVDVDMGKGFVPMVKDECKR